ncbi:hypothetical protein [Olivibacter sitiensis]|uniref:hypothetical protein n=1 Tax=Olivibacter sitiensis TaxID=376470 RepID=UPI0003F64AB6|nr:hypothetical protein [Olivibacter sitiensis]
MKKEQLFQELKQTMGKVQVQNVAKRLAEGKFDLNDLLDLCFTKPDVLAFRAAWILEQIDSLYPEQFSLIFFRFIQRMPEQVNESCQRHFTKILMNYTHAKAPAVRQVPYSRLTVAQREKLVECQFDWLVDPDTPVAVRVNVMDILYNMSGEFPWIKEELAPQIEFFLRDGSAAMQSRGKRLLKRMRVAHLKDERFLKTKS